VAWGMETVRVFDVVGLQGLIAEYGRLRRLEGGHTPQTRGQRFNEVVAAMMRCWGIAANASIRSPGEIDVGFSAHGVRYVVEAKWERAKTNTGHVAKLQKRVRQRMAGTYGIFLSMAGYSPEALADVAHGERLEVLLLDAAHFEAMLAGLVPPEEMLTLLHDRAAFHGEAYTPLAALLATAGLPLARGVLAERATGLVRAAMPGVTGEVLFSVPDSNQLGLACLNRDRLLVTTQRGIVDVDLSGRDSRWAVPVPGCHRNPLVDADGGIVFTRRSGVGRWHNGDLTVLGGGLAGTTCLLRHPDGGRWVFSNGDPNRSVGASVTRLGDRLGDEARHGHDYPAGSAMNCCWLNGSEVVAVGGRGLSVSAIPSGSSRWLNVSHANPMGLVRLTPMTVLTGGDEVSLVSTDLAGGRSTEVAQLHLRGSVNELAVGVDGSIYLAAYYYTSDDRMTFVVARICVPLEIDTDAVAMPTAFQAGPAPDTSDSAPHLDTGPRAVAASIAGAAPAAASEQRQEPAPDLMGASWQVTRPDRGNRSGEYVAFQGRGGIYWAIVGIISLLIAVLVIVIAASETSVVVKIIVGLIVVFLVTITGGCARMAGAPIRLEIGAQGIQVFARSETSWFPWQVIDRVEVMRLEGGNLHVVAWCARANMFPEFDGFGGGPRYLPRLGAVAVCPITVLRTRRHLIVRALHTYGGNRIGTL